MRLYPLQICCIGGKPVMSLKRTENGLFIVFEGGEGSGKTTMAKHAVNYLIEKGYDAI